MLLVCVSCVKQLVKPSQFTTGQTLTAATKRCILDVFSQTITTPWLVVSQNQILAECNVLVSNFTVSLIIKLCHDSHFYNQTSSSLLSLVQLAYDVMYINSDAWKIHLIQCFCRQQLKHAMCTCLSSTGASLNFGLHNECSLSTYPSQQ